MFEAFKHFDIQVEPQISIHGITAGAGPPLLLLHGFPQTHHIWHLIAPQLIASFTVVAIDLRGYGASSKPPPTSTHAAYAKSAMAKDCVSVMSHLGLEKFSIISHDRGARVAHKLCVDHPGRVEKCMILDIAPTLSMYNQTNQLFATFYWHWFFLIQPNPFPENLILKNPELFQERFFGGLYSGTHLGEGIMHEEAMREYVAQLTDKDTVAGMCEDYRAASTIDLEEAKKDIEEGRNIKCALRVLWGKKGVIERCFDALAEWRAVSDREVSGEAVDGGHFIAEEVPDLLVRHVKEFFS
jgi:haloacetate dehalogenase